MKTISEAYKALDGDLNNAWNYTVGVEDYVFYRVKSGDYSCYPFNHSCADFQYICTANEFNEYVKADKKLLEKESKVDYTSKEFWKDAPEGKNYLITYKSGVVAQVYNYFTAKPEIVDGYYRIAGESVGYGASSWEVFERPKPQPIFTKAMQEAGEFPSVGMECMVYNAELMNPEYEKAVIDFIGSHIVVYSSESCTERTCNLELVKFKPIDTRTDKEKAIDDLRNADDSVCNDIEWHKNFLQLIIDGKIHGVTWSGNNE